MKVACYLMLPSHVREYNLIDCHLITLYVCLIAGMNI